MRVLRYRLRRGSGGAGRFAGGDGIERAVLVLEDVAVSLITERRPSRPWGMAGGQPGATGQNWRLPGGEEGRAERLPDKCTVQLRAGDVLRVRTPGGGGEGRSGLTRAARPHRARRRRGGLGRPARRPAPSGRRRRRDPFVGRPA